MTMQFERTKAEILYRQFLDDARKEPVAEHLVLEFITPYGGKIGEYPDLCLEVFNVLIAPKALSYCKNQYLINAVRQDYLKGVKAAIESGAKVHYEQHRALHEAVERGNIEIVEYLVLKGARFDDIDPSWVQGANLISAAARNNQVDMIDYLVEKGLDPHANNEHALGWASSHNCVETIELLCLKYHANPNNKTADKSRLPLVWALDCAQFEAFYMLIECGANYQSIGQDLLKSALYTEGNKGLEIVLPYVGKTDQKTVLESMNKEMNLSSTTLKNLKLLQHHVLQEDLMIHPEPRKKAKL